MNLFSTIVTHGGTFQADEAVAVALLRLFASIKWSTVPKVIRTRDETDLVLYGLARDTVILDGLARDTVILDVGHKYHPPYQLDHHQMPTPLAADEHPLSSAGMVLEHWWKQLEIFPKKMGELSHFIHNIDVSDNGGKVEGWSFSYLIHKLSPVECGDPALFDKRFEQVVTLLQDMLTSFFMEESMDNAMRWFESHANVLKWSTDYDVWKMGSAERVRIAIKESWDSPILKLFQYEPAAAEVACLYPDLLYIVFPSPDKQWQVRQVPVNRDNYRTGRKPFPAAWAGLEHKAFRDVCGVRDAIFCHSGRWICGAGSLIGAMELAKIAMKHAEQPLMAAQV